MICDLPPDVHNYHALDHVQLQAWSVAFHQMYSYHALDYYHHISLDKMSLDPALLKKSVS
jgi:hypothetical protein